MMSTIYRHFSTVRPALTKYATNSALKTAAASTDSSTLNVLQYALSLEEPNHSWTKSQLKEIYETPLLELTHAAQLQHRKWHDPSKVQLCTLMNIKSGGCSEDCKYCAQSSRNDTGLKAEKMVKVDEVIKEAEEAKRNGSTRFCLGAAWRDMKGRKSAMKRIEDMITKVNDMGLETCVTLGMVDQDQAKQLKEAGLTAYNHNIDTSREHYSKVITTRTYDDRLQTIKNVQNSGIKACTGGILGLGESEDDHIGFIYTLSNMTPHPESLPINRLVAIKGTPMAEELADPKSKKLQFDEILRTIATARIVMPKAIIRLAAGRYTMKETEQFVCFMAGCNSIFTGKKMLTTMCNGWDEDKAMLAKWGLQPMEAFKYDRS
ncbi:bio2p [Saccharomyces arboricola H-6]|uniref:biotin synthase n=1 Tax=Saccharomyces arboricola (strain H-6 / AS 2.3317 / CBS 10644) TaxID=1160507 RepID=J8Q4T0_SACAR|nr:bio2p [Saccharomyces arboricola H-6]